VREERIKELRESTKSALNLAWRLRDQLYCCDTCAVTAGNGELSEKLESMWYGLNWIIIRLEEIYEKLGGDS